MPEIVSRAQVQQLVEQGAQLVEVLPAEEYEREHLPGAINIPLKDFPKGKLSQLDSGRPVITYCADTQ